MRTRLSRTQLVRRFLTVLVRVLVVSAFVSPSPAFALILRGDAENPLPPTVPGAADLGAWVGELQSSATPGFLGTPIGPRHFLTAAHIAFAPGDPFLFRGVVSRVVARVAIPGSDLALGEVDTVFPAFVELYERDDEVRRPLVVLGKGRWKGEPVVVDGALRGWRYAESGVPGVRWGTNTVEGTLSVPADSGSGLLGDFLVADFDGAGGADEVHLTTGDSGSPVFLRDCDVWKLAAVASGVEGPFVYRAGGARVPFLAALFDARGFAVVEDDAMERPIPETADPQPSSWYAARVSTRLAEVRAAVGLPLLPSGPRPDDRFVWSGAEVSIPLPSAPAVAPVATTPEAWTVACVDEHSAAGGGLRAVDAGVVYRAPDSAPDVDVFRYAVRSEGSLSRWGRVFVVSRPDSLPVPRVLFDPEGVAVVLWPVGERDVAEVQRADRAEGPWETFRTRVARLETVWLFADEARSEKGSARFYRLVLR